MTSGHQRRPLATLVRSKLGRAGSLLPKPWTDSPTVPHGPNVRPGWMHGSTGFAPIHGARWRTAPKPWFGFKTWRVPGEEQARLLEDPRAHLVGLLHTGALLALGFTVETGSSSKLAIVPRDAWASAVAIDWDRSGIQGKDADFFDVRVLPPDRDRLKNANAGAAQLAAAQPVTMDR